MDGDIKENSIKYIEGEKMVDIAFLEGIGAGIIASLIIATMIYKLRIMGFKNKISDLDENINKLKKRISELEWIISDLKNSQRRERKIGDPGPPTGWEKEPDGVFTTMNKMLEAGM